MTCAHDLCEPTAKRVITDILLNVFPLFNISHSHLVIYPPLTYSLAHTLSLDNEIKRSTFLQSCLMDSSILHVETPSFRRQFPKINRFFNPLCLHSRIYSIQHNYWLCPLRLFINDITIEPHHNQMTI